MVHFKFFLAIVLCAIVSISHAGNPNKNYTVKYIEDKSGDCYPMNM